MSSRWMVVAVLAGLMTAGCQTAKVQTAPMPPPAPDYVAALGLRTFTAEPLIPYLTSSDTEVRDGAVMTIRALADASSLDALIQIAQSRADANVRAAAVESFWRTEDPRLVDLLKGLMRDSNENLRRAAFVAAGNVANPGLMDALVEAVDREATLGSDNSSSPYATTPMMQAAVSALGNFADRRATQKLLAMLKNPNRQIRQQAAEALRRTRGEGVTDIIDFLAANTDPSREDYFYYQLIEVARNSTDSRMPSVMLGLFDSSNMSVRSSAGSMLSQVANKTIAVPLKDILEKGRTPKGRTLSDQDLYVLLQSAGNIGDASFARVLVGYLKSDRDMVVSQASQALDRCVDIAVTEDIVKTWQEAKKDSTRQMMRQLVSSGSYPILWNQDANTCELDKPRLRALRGEPEPEPEPAPAIEAVPVAEVAPEEQAVSEPEAEVAPAGETAPAEQAAPAESTSP